MFKRYGVLLTVIGLVMAVTVPAMAGPDGTDRPMAGNATGYASYGFTAPDGSGAGTDGLANVLECNIELPIPDFFKVTTFTSADGIVTHLGKTHFEFTHCPGPTGPYNGQIALVAANGDVLYGEYGGSYEEDGVYLDIEFKGESSDGTCHLLNDVPCESTGRFAGASGEATMIADAVPGDPDDDFVPWPWWGEMVGELSY